MWNDRRSFLKLAAAALPAFPQTSARRARPNVLVILTDDQGYGDMSCHGNPVLKTPNMDRLYAESVRFTDFHVAPMCTPTRGQLMSVDVPSGAVRGSAPWSATDTVRRSSAS